MTVECRNVIEDPTRGEIICLDTGEVIADHLIQEGTPWRAYNAEEWMQRVHASSTTNVVHDSGLITDVKLIARDYKLKMKSLKLRSLQHRIRVSKDQRRLVEALTKMNKVAAQLGLPEAVKETAGILVKKIISNLNPRKSKIDVYVAVAIIQAARLHNIPLRAKDVLPLLGVSEQQYWRAVTEVTFSVDGIPKKSTLDPRTFLQRIVANLGLSQRVYTLASRIIAVLKERGHTEGKDPAGIAAAAVYVASIIMNEKRTQREVASAANVTEVTIRNRYKDIVDKVEIYVYV